MSLRSAAALICTLTLVLASSGCSSDDAAAPGGPGVSAGNGTESGEFPEVRTTASLGRVTGVLGKPVKSQIKKRITAVVDDWFDAAYVAGKYPRSDFTGAFPHFTRGATQRARKDVALMSNATIGERIDSVRAMNRQLKIDVLAVGRRPVAVTARVVLGMQVEGEISRRERVAGSLYLTYGNGSWQVFGYDMTRGII